jgi:hypothetical protein
MGRIRGVVIEPAKFGLDAVRRKTVTISGAIEKRLDTAGQHRNGAAGMGEQPFDVAHLRRCPANQKTNNRARRIVGHFDHRGERADVDSATAARDQRMDVDHRFAPVQLLENGPVSRIAEPFISVIRL